MDGLTFEKLRWQDKPIPPQAPDIHEKLRDPFNPNSGIWAINIRKPGKTICLSTPQAVATGTGAGGAEDGRQI